MPLTAAQNTAIKNDILASADLNAFPNTMDGAYEIANLYNKIATPDFVVWKTKLHEQEITSLTSSEGTTWSWPAFIARSAGEQAGWNRMFNGTYTINPSLVQIRNGVADIFSGSANSAPAQRTHLLAIAKEKATRIEKLLADTANGAGTTAAPATRTHVGNISYQDVYTARNS